MICLIRMPLGLWPSGFGHTYQANHLCVLCVTLCTSYICIQYFLVVPDPVISMDAHAIQTVSKPLTLDCNITTVRGITSRVDIVWSSNGLELRKIEGTESNLTQDNSVLYMDSYTIPQLGTVDEGRIYQCGIIINQAIPIVFNSNITLDVTGELHIL